MKRRLWIVVTVPLLLLGATLWVRKAAWERLEGEFRQRMLADATRNPQCLFVVSAERKNWAKELETVELETWTPVQLKAVLADIHLQKASLPTSRTVVNNGTLLLFEAFVGEPEPVSGFYIRLGGSGGFIGGTRTSQQFNEKWSQFELTPASRQVLEHRIQKQYANELHTNALPTP